MKPGRREKNADAFLRPQSPAGLKGGRAENIRGKRAD